jgi:hypothetical protein
MFKKHKSKIIAGIIVIISLIVAFFADSKLPYNQSIDEAKIEKTLSLPETVSNDSNQPQKETPVLTQKEEKKTENPEEAKEPTKQKESGPVIEKTTETEPIIETTEEAESITESVSEPEPEKSNELTCTMSVRCDTILKNISLLKKEKRGILPQDGVIYSKQTVAFSQGESVFDLLVREMRKNKIHLEFVKTPGLNSAYIEGIGNLYEFDCGDMSGWMCKVNGQFLKTGHSGYILKNEDNVEWVYTCDFGKDVRENYAK